MSKHGKHVCMRVYVFVIVELCSSYEALCRYAAAFGIHRSWIIYPTPMLHILVLPALLITVFFIWSHSTCLFVFCSPSAVFSMSPHASMSAALPTGFWFMNPILVCHYCLQKGALMDQYVESVTRRITSYPQTSWIFFWQPVACSISDLDDTLADVILRCDNKFWVSSFCRYQFWGRGPPTRAMLDKKYFCGCHNPPWFVLNLSVDPHMILWG